MHDNNNKDDMHKGMLWMMVVCCGVPLVLVLVFGAGGTALGAPAWVMFGFVAIMLVVHFSRMGISHMHSDKGHGVVDEEGRNKDGKDNTTNSGHGCCH